MEVALTVALVQLVAAVAAWVVVEVVVLAQPAVAVA